MPTLNTPTRQYTHKPITEQSDPTILYHRLLQQPQQHLTSARQFLQRQLHQASLQPCDLPTDPQQLSEWVKAGSARTTSAYSDYLTARKQGQPRRFFASRAHAMYFLRGVAPTKLVDGAWLYGVLSQWQDWRFHSLVRTYLEELGDSEPLQNHVVLYKQLLNTHELNDPDTLSAGHYVQGAQQLALAHLAKDFLPELIGYNLGYEQLPLHLLITTYELNELGIDPYYFQLHVTIDNADTGHAQKAAHAVLDNLPISGDADAFYQRVKLGYQLNELGISSMDVIGSFNLEAEVHRVLEQKALVARNMHSDFCRIQGRTVNEWLSQPGRTGEFLAALEKRGWILRDTDPTESRFWQLIQGNRAPMFGVFSAYEMQLLHDWIAGEWSAPTTQRQPRRYVAPKVAAEPVDAGDFDAEQTALHRHLRKLPASELMDELIKLMSPSSHFTPDGLLATRLFAQAMGQRGA
ncbi:Iron-containing redox enzyme [Halopseudomonas litoralis]|uniref:Iron-containing redox enzyme n=1 Tax=Halopseudomonas litoralis TaxID=797277 RepID=A0A1H1PIA3_9GAMM|nr:iron-containing redox enzyme family protein [Halopseudomonas litoralis]SDS10972.1 Iron-containing redox enzyme [Halopseudomonas litoralis]